MDGEDLNGKTWQRGKSPVIKFPIENYLSLNAEVLGVANSRIAKDESLNVIFNNKDSGYKNDVGSLRQQWEIPLCRD